MGEIFFRGRYHPAPHPRLVGAEVFEAAQAILESRGEDMALRRTNGSEYLLTGLLLCEKCGKRFIGASAKGNAYRYTYYVCFSRHRYGSTECDQDRLRADELEDRVVESLLATLARRDLLEAAVERWGEIVEARRPDREQELAAVEAHPQDPGIVGSLLQGLRGREAPGGGLHPTHRGALGGADVPRGPAH